MAAVCRMKLYCPYRNSCKNHQEPKVATVFAAVRGGYTCSQHPWHHASTTRSQSSAALIAGLAGMTSMTSFSIIYQKCPKVLAAADATRVDGKPAYPPVVLHSTYSSRSISCSASFLSPLLARGGGGAGRARNGHLLQAHSGLQSVPQCNQVWRPVVAGTVGMFPCDAVGSRNKPNCERCRCRS